MNFIGKTNRSQAGQGTVEYVLLLVVVVTVIFGLLSQFNTAFGAWGKNYFGNYVACLLEYGELPSLGGGTQVEGCDAAFEEFSLANGKNPFGPGIGEGGGGDQGKKKDGSGEGGGAGRTTADSSGRSGRSFLSGSNSSRNGGASGSGRIGRFERNSDDASGEDLFGDGKSNRMSKDEARESVLRPRQIYSSYFSATEEKKAVEKKAKVAKESETTTRPPRLTVRERSLRKTAAMEDTGFDLGFGGFIRFLFITGIIIAIIILLGGQALQISKEWD